MADVNRYPDPGNSALRSRLSKRYGVPASRIAIGNGSCDILLAAGEALLEPGAEVVYSWPSFSVYPQVAALTGATAVTVDLDGDDRHDLPAMADAVTVATRLLIVCNPNNPTATAVRSAARSRRCWRAVPRAGVRGGGRGLLRVQPHRRLRRHARPARVHTPTWSCCARSPRSTACAGCGWASRCAAPRSCPRRSTAVRQPFFCNTAAQAAALEALGHQDEVERRVERAVAGRLTLEAGARELGLHGVGVAGQLRVVGPGRRARRGGGGARAGRARSAGACGRRRWAARAGCE